jgi:hypothetical protein
MNPDHSPTPFLGRRRFIKGTVATAATFQIVPRHVLGGTGHVPPSEKMNIGCVGVGGMMGGGDVNGVSGENIYALCDVDANFLGKSAASHPKAKQYRDFREMPDKEHKNLDGITVAVPDHMHATISVWAMEGFQKPEQVIPRSPGHYQDWIRACKGWELKDIIG